MTSVLSGCSIWFLVMTALCVTGTAEASDAPLPVAPQMQVGAVKRVSGRRFLAAQSCNDKVVRVEKDLLTGELRLRAMAPGKTELVLERVNHPVAVRLSVSVLPKPERSSTASRRVAKGAPGRLLVVPGWDDL
jgi:hypothetical protein